MSNWYGYHGELGPMLLAIEGEGEGVLALGVEGHLEGSHERSVRSPLVVEVERGREPSTVLEQLEDVAEGVLEAHQLLDAALVELLGGALLVGDPGLLEVLARRLQRMLEIDVFANSAILVENLTRIAGGVKESERVASEGEIRQYLSYVLEPLLFVDHESHVLPGLAGGGLCRGHAVFGGPAARLAQDCIRKVEVMEYEELGMEAIWRIEVENFPAFIVVDDKGNDFFQEFNQPIHNG